MSSGRYQDQARTCVDCGRQFVWTADDQEYFHRQGFTTPPKRCRECRHAKKAARGDDRNSGYGPH